MATQEPAIGGVARRAPRTRLSKRGRRVLRFGAASLMITGALLLARVGYELWGTGVATAHAQSSFRAKIASQGFPARPIPGDAIGFIRIPRISLDMAFVQGVYSGALARGPGHYPKTPMPGMGGNVAIAGHRTTHLAPFWALQTLRPNDQIILQTRQGTFVYRVLWVRILKPDETWITTPTKRPSLTLTTCNPRFSAKQRMVVRAIQIYGLTPHGFIDHRMAMPPVG